MRYVEALEPRKLMSVTVPEGFAATTVAAGLNGPTTIATAPDGRTFVAEQTGALRMIRGGKLRDRPFARFAVDSAGERGLLGVTFDSAFKKNHYVYVYYTVPAKGDAPAHNRVSRVTSRGDTVVRGSEHVLLDLDPLSSATNHNGGAIRFGPDGKLYVSTGDNAHRPNSQDLHSLLGKILRIRADGSTPSDPAFAKTRGKFRIIYACGLRNPFNFDFDPASGRMLINDVGAQTYEEINVGRPGGNYGWPNTEGPTGKTSYDAPLYYYGHGVGPATGEAIVGSAFYSPATRTFPAGYAGGYFFADLASGWVRKIDPATGDVAPFASDLTLPVGLSVQADGSLWCLSRGSGDADGSVTRIQYVA